MPDRTRADALRPGDVFLERGRGWRLIAVLAQDDDGDCDCMVPVLEGAGQHSPGCRVFRLKLHVSPEHAQVAEGVIYLAGSAEVALVKAGPK